ncbi:helix-turn-helix transcriptional regulator [Thermomonospora umbrina]|uniref:Regulatory LuxR family protein n=1 Tax=Thermomonospora umbrina TaxID=111806 RepID=A0A3D9SVQ8_9ACTN|nr:response regulator transcription factor [Thermomonospora umbrina]REF00017.1 regulatory LuxR family protein [Thermomonospora umbrina]
MGSNGWSDPRQVLESAHIVLGAPLDEVPARLSQILAELVPHRALAMLTGTCARQPLRAHGDAAVTGRVSSAELARLAETVVPGEPWSGEATLGGVARPVLAVACDPGGAAGSLLAVVPPRVADPGEAAGQVVQRLWDVVTLHLTVRMSAADPVPLAHNRIAASERARAIGELTDLHRVTLTTLLSTLRSRRLDDTAARRAATDLAVSALIDLRTAGEVDRALSEEPADRAFARLADELRLLAHYGEVSLELVGPGQDERSLPADITNTARVLVRGTVLAMLEQDGLRRIRASWQPTDGELRVTVRDDGPGTLSADTLTAHRLTERVRALNGTLALEATPGWGTLVTVTLPLTAPPGPATDPLVALNPRELEVLRQLTLGHRNRQIAERLHISERTVKFHVTNILDKLDVGSRGEAAATARSAGL